MQEANVAKKFESAMFKDIWCLQCCPNGRVGKTKTAGEVRIYLQLCGLPINVRSIFVEYFIEFEETKAKDRGIHFIYFYPFYLYSV